MDNVKCPTSGACGQAEHTSDSAAYWSCKQRYHASQHTVYTENMSPEMNMFGVRKGLISNPHKLPSVFACSFGSYDSKVAHTSRKLVFDNNDNSVGCVVTINGEHGTYQLTYRYGIGGFDLMDVQGFGLVPALFLNSEGRLSVGSPEVAPTCIEDFTAISENAAFAKEVDCNLGNISEIMLRLCIKLHKRGECQVPSKEAA